MILPMARVELVGPLELLARAIAFVQAQGVLELRTPSGGDSPPAAAPSVHEDLENRLQEALRRIDALAARLPPARAGGPPAPLPGVVAEAFLPRLAALEAELAALEARRGSLREEREATDRFARLVTALAPLAHDVPPSAEPELHGLVLRTDPVAIALLEAEVRRLAAGACEVKSRPFDAERTGVLLVVPRACGRALSALLFERGVDEVKLPAAYGGKRLLETLLHLARRWRALPAELAEAEAALQRLADGLAPALRGARAEAEAALSRLAAEGRCRATRFAFVLSGYMPAARVDSLRGAAEEALGVGVAVLARPPAREEWDEVPVVLRNRPAIRPFERLLALVPLPRYGSIDPTPWLAVFFPTFFGMVLGDVAFGAVGLAAALLFRARAGTGEAGRDLAWVALWCSASAAVFGLLFGEALGELGARVGLHPILLDRRGAVMAFLGVALCAGGVHVALGMALGVASAAASGHRRESIARAAKLLLLGAAGLAAATLAGVAPGSVLRPALVSGAVLLGVALAAEGPMAALDLVLGIGNVLSYARLMALGLASVMLAEVANLIAGTLRPQVAGVILGVLLHAINFSLGLISPTVAALRLHYVEFFEKFYDARGLPFRPFALTG
jgi:V/A-type H+-transporting ATPase subunit I